MGEAAADVMKEVDALAAEPSLAGGAADSWKTKDSPLSGEWLNLWTTAADATFDEKTERGAAKVSNAGGRAGDATNRFAAAAATRPRRCCGRDIAAATPSLPPRRRRDPVPADDPRQRRRDFGAQVVDAATGRITNVIQFTGAASKVDTLKVRLTAKSVGPSRLELTFRWVKVTFRKRLFRIFKSIIIPVPASFIARVLFLFRPKKKPPLPYFDLLYLDESLRVQRTGEGNVFVQQKA